jgi:lysophospholipase L1-like esterase
MKKICLFGDSISKGVVFDTIKNRYVYVKESFTKLVSSQNEIEISNHAKFGCTILKGVDMVEEYMDEIAESDFTVLEFGGNDSDYDWRRISEDPGAHHEPKTPFLQFGDCYAGLLSMFKDKDINLAVMNLPPIDEQKYFDWVSRGLNRENILSWLGGDVGYIYRWHESYNMQVCCLANRFNVPLIDIRTPFLELRNYGDYLSVDGIHPNSMGHALISETIGKYIEKMDIYSNARRFALN